MKNSLFPIIALCFLSSITLTRCTSHTVTEPSVNLAAVFAAPPDSVKPSCFWWWFNSLVNEEGITRDLEEFKAKGLGSVTLVCTGNDYGVAPMPRGPVFLSTEWRRLYRYALREAYRLGLEVGVNFCGGGWDMGGAWIKPEFSSRWYVQSQLSLKGPLKFSGLLPKPGYRSGYNPPHEGNVNHYMTWPAEKADYQVTSVVAFPESANSASIGTERGIHLAAKSNRKDGNCFLPARTAMDQTLVAWTTLPGDQPVNPGSVIDLTSRLNPDGTLNWEVPAGQWTILQTGHVLIGCDVRCVLPEVGYVLEVDWLNPAAVDEMFTNLGSVLIDDAGPLIGNTLKYFHTDSFEDGFPNWTASLLEKFKQYRGYDPTPYLPVFAGKMVGSAEISDRFLYDYRKTVADCMADGNYGRFAERSKQYELEIQCEAGGPSWSGTVCMDALKNLGRCAKPMGEFWQDGTFVVNGQNKVGKQTASAAHIYGRRTASAEAFTGFRHWGESPASLKPTADRAFCEGINRFVFHTMTSTRPVDGKPGYEYGAGTHFNPNVTWWQQAAGPWLSYVNRCQALLQSGKFVADVLYYNGDWAPNLVEPKHTDPNLGPGYDYDVCNAEVLMTRLSVKDGRLVMPDGMSYCLLVLPESKTMPLEVLIKIRDLVEAGATVAGPPPQSDPGLRDYPECDLQVQKIAAELWGNVDGSKIWERKVGLGEIIMGRALKEILEKNHVSPDFLSVGRKDTLIDFIHRSTENEEIYFLSNRSSSPEKVTASFRISGREPELWDPVTGELRLLPQHKLKEGRTNVPLEFEPNGSMFVVFRSGTNPPAKKYPGPNFPEMKVLQEISGPWKVQFDPEWFYPADGLSGDQEKGSFVYDQLLDWSQQSEPAVKHFSGTAVYRQSFRIQPGSTGKRLFLDLGVVKETARVILNGIDLGVIWCHPWRVEITKAVTSGENNLEIEVVNLWPNRLVGDANLPAAQRRTRTNVITKPDQPLLPSGLIGPVQIYLTSK